MPTALVRQLLERLKQRPRSRHPIIDTEVVWLEEQELAMLVKAISDHKASDHHWQRTVPVDVIIVGKWKTSDGKSGPILVIRSEERPLGSRMVSRDYSCPTCGKLLDCIATPKGSPYEARTIAMLMTDAVRAHRRDDGCACDGDWITGPAKTLIDPELIAPELVATDGDDTGHHDMVAR